MLSIFAIICVRNNTHTLPAVIQHFINNNIQVVIIDNESTDDTISNVRKKFGDKINNIEILPFTGVLGLARQMATKEKITHQIKADWVIHADADEILESPVKSESLRQFIERIDREGFNVIDCDEFVFVPTNENEAFESNSFVESMKDCYYFNPPDRALHRILKKEILSDNWQNGSGHIVTGNSLKISHEKAVLRHYIGLSMDHIRKQYFSRIFPAEALLRGWHANRFLLDESNLCVLVKKDLLVPSVTGWNKSTPFKKHLLFKQGNKKSLPPIIYKNEVFPPVYFIYGDLHLIQPTLEAFTLKYFPQITFITSPWLNQILHLPQSGEEQASDPGISDPIYALLHSDDGNNPFHLTDRTKDQQTIAAEVLKHICRKSSNVTYVFLIDTPFPKFGWWLNYQPSFRVMHCLHDGRKKLSKGQMIQKLNSGEVKKCAIDWTLDMRNVRQAGMFLPVYIEMPFELLDSDPCEAKDILDTFYTWKKPNIFTRLSQRIRKTNPQNIVHLVSHRDSRIPAGNINAEASHIRQFENIAGDMLADVGYKRFYKD